MSYRTRTTRASVPPAHVDEVYELNLVPNLGPKDISRAEENDSDIAHVLAWLKSGFGRPQWSDVSALSEISKIFWAQWDSMCIISNILYRKRESSDGTSIQLQLVLPKSLRKEVLTHLHNHPTGGRFGVRKTVEKVKEKFY